MKIGTVFSGMGGVETGAIMAGINPVWSIELDAEIAAVADANLGTETIVANVLDIDPAHLEPVDIFHASPPCPNFSNAKKKSERGETELDLALGRKTAEFIRVLQPKYVTLENVYGYRNSESWRIIERQLCESGYFCTVDHVNSADYGVPQTRKRMIVRAAKGQFVPMLQPTCREWVGWRKPIKEIIEDLKPFIPSPSHAISVEKATSINEVSEFALMDTQNVSGSQTVRTQDEPAFTVVASAARGMPAISIRGGKYKRVNRRRLARFQSFPDHMTKNLHTRGIGNAVPPLMYKEIITQLVAA